MRKPFFPTLGFLLVALLGAPPGACAQEDVVLKAMRDEMARTMKQLQLQNLPKPYYVEFQIRDMTSTAISATLGALTADEQTHVRWLKVEVRVGDYNLDNTNFASMPSFGGAGVSHAFGNIVQLPLDDNYKEIRRQIWLVTDAAYKDAVQAMARKRAALENKTRSEDLPDLSREPVFTYFAKPVAADLDADRARSMVRKLSSVYRGNSALEQSSAAIAKIDEFSRYLNSEGTEFTRSTPFVGLTVMAKTEADDGMPLGDAITVYGRSMSEFSDDRLEAQVREMGAHLAELRKAPLVEQYNGPVLFEGQASAEIFAQAFAAKLLASRRPVSDNPTFEMIFSRAQSPFQTRLGARVLPEWASITDDATLKDYQGQPLEGSYAVDDEGVRAGKTELVVNGVVKSLLVSRAPVRGLDHSTGSVRGLGVAPSNLIFTARDGLDGQALKAKLLSLVRERGVPYGIIVRRLKNPLAGDPQEAMSSVMDSIMPGMGGSGPIYSASLVYKVFPDGHEQLVRNAQVEGLNQASFKDLIAASSTARVYNKLFVDPASMVTRVFSGGGMPDGGNLPLVSLVVPDLVFDEVSINPPSGSTPKPPLSLPPMGD